MGSASSIPGARDKARAAAAAAAAAAADAGPSVAETIFALDQEHDTLAGVAEACLARALAGEDKTMRAAVTAFLQARYAAEGLEFLLAVRRFAAVVDETLNERAQAIFDNFVAPGALSEVTLPKDVRNRIAHKLVTGTDLDFDAFDDAAAVVSHDLVKDALGSFVQMNRAS